jgi:hypothetical protein
MLICGACLAVHSVVKTELLPRRTKEPTGPCFEQFETLCVRLQNAQSATNIRKYDSLLWVTTYQCWFALLLV